jgi:hypothetical protein
VKRADLAGTDHACVVPVLYSAEPRPCLSVP